MFGALQNTERHLWYTKDMEDKKKECNWWSPLYCIVSIFSHPVICVQLLRLCDDQGEVSLQFGQKGRYVENKEFDIKNNRINIKH